MEKIVLVPSGDARVFRRDGHRPESNELLSSFGMNHLRKVTQRLAQYSPQRVVSAPEASALQSGIIIAAEIGIPMELSVDLRRQQHDVEQQSHTQAYAVNHTSAGMEPYAIQPNGTRETTRQYKRRLIQAMQSLTKSKEQVVVAVLHKSASMQLLLEIMEHIGFDQSKLESVGDGKDVRTAFYEFSEYQGVPI